MNEEKDEKWLDELICRTIKTEKPHFDHEKWQKQYPEEFKILFSRAKQTSAGQPSIWRMIYKSKITKLAAAAVIIIAIGLSLVHQGPGEQVDSKNISEVEEFPVKMMTSVSLSLAYRKGGMDAVERQCEKAFKMSGPQVTNVTVQELLAEFNGT